MHYRLRLPRSLEEYGPLAPLQREARAADLDRYVNPNEDFVLVVLVFMRLLIPQHRRVDRGL